MGIRILGTGSYAPEFTLSNADFEKIVDTNDEWITTRTGIKQRHISTGQTTWYIGYMAAKQAIEDAGIDPSEIGLIIDTSVTHEYHTPSTACVIQGHLNAQNASAFDLQAACAGFVFALDCAHRYLLTDDSIKYALVISNEELSEITNYEDRSSCVLFGDGAAAALITRDDSKKFTSYTHTKGEGAKYLYAKKIMPKTRFQNDFKDEYYDGFSNEGKEGCLVQNGREVYKFATRALPEAIEKAAAKAGLDVNKIDYIIPHQANIRIIETAAKNLGVSMDKFLINIPDHGNTSSASVPICFDEFRKKGQFKKGDIVCFVGFGAGLTYGAVIAEY